MGLRRWLRRRAILDEAEFRVRLAEVKAREAIAAYKVKSDIEWDLKWAEGGYKSWAPTAILALWSLPTVGFFVPALRPYIEAGFQAMSVYSPDLPTYFMAGWGVIFAATFGIEKAIALFAPGRTARLIEAMSKAPDDVPPEVVEEVRTGQPAAADQ